MGRALRMNMIGNSDNFQLESSQRPIILKTPIQKYNKNIMFRTLNGKKLKNH